MDAAEVKNEPTLDLPVEAINVARDAASNLGTGRGQLVAQRRPPFPPERLQEALIALQKAKAESDRGNYGAKHSIMRELLLKSPKDFKIDSKDGKFVGVTHIPSNFRMHLPANVIPVPTSPQV